MNDLVQHHASSASTQRFQRPGKILIVDHDQSILKSFSEFLGQRLHTVLKTDSGAQALSIIQQDSPELVILDATLSDASGFEICSAIKQDSEFHAIPVIMVLHEGTDAEVAQCTESGANDFIYSPFKFAVLEARVRAMLKYRRALIELQKAQSELEARVAERTRQLSESNLELKGEVQVRRRAEAALSEIIHHAHCILWRAKVHSPAPGKFEWEMQVFSSESMRRELGLKKEANETVAQMWRRMLASNSSQVERMEKTCHSALVSGAPNYSQEFSLIAADGSTRWMYETAEITHESSIRWFLVGVVTDITRRKTIEMALRASEERYALAEAGVNDGLWDWNLETQELYLSPRWKSMIDADQDQIGKDPDEWFSRVHPNDISQLNIALNEHFEGKTSHFECEYRLMHSDGSYRWMLSRGMAVRTNDSVTRIAGSQTDITARKSAELQLMHDAFHDELTGLPNRALLRDRIRKAISRTKREDDYRFAVLFLDIDRFKIVNDSLGHGIGDRLLMEFARRLQSCPRTTDTLARLGGDEFVILLEGIEGPEEAHAFANKVEYELKKPFIVDGRQLFATATAGIVMGNSAYEQPDEVLRDADTALYQAKSLGMGQREVFTSGLHTKVLSLLDLEQDLRKAVQNNEFILHYQPIVSLENGLISGFEALARWNHPLRGIVGPVEFIALAEETDLIHTITFDLLRKACTQLRIWQTTFENDTLSMSVNLSGKAFSLWNLVPEIKRTLGETGVLPGTVKLELTESSLMQNAETAMAILSELKAMSLELLIDDFGTGYSSLSYLHRLPLDVLKIDRSFMIGVDKGEKNLNIVKTIALMAGNLGMKTVAEGVETIEQLAHVRSLKCEFAQGYYFSRPLSAAMAGELLAQKPHW